MHEHLDEFGLINMNGRMYDPLVAQFLSPDPYVQAPGNWYNYNRYAYCLNNPMIYSDPSGEVFVIDDLILAAVIGGFINTAIQGATGNINSAGDFFGSFGIGALSGLAGGVAGQAVSSALGSVGALAGAATGASAGAAGGFVGGVGNAWAGGASFGNGLKQGLIGAGAGALTGGVIGGVAGGINAVYGDMNHQRNFWTGKDIAMGRKPFSLYNVDKQYNALATKLSRLESRFYYESVLDGTRKGAGMDQVRWGTAAENEISNGSISRLENYTMPPDGTTTVEVGAFRGRSDMRIINTSGNEVIITVNGNVVTPTNGYIPLWEGSKTVIVKIVNTPAYSETVSPFKFIITGRNPLNNKY